MIPATYDEAAVHIGRLLAHFPRREITRDAVVIGDIAGAIVADKASLVAMHVVCDRLWKASSKDNPWPPASGDIFREINEQTQLYRSAVERISRQKEVALPPPSEENRPPDPYGGRKWPDFTDEDKALLMEDFKKLTPSLWPMWRRLYQVPADFEIKFGDKKDE